jgi:hypothetical protein
LMKNSLNIYHFVDFNDMVFIIAGRGL